MKLCKKCEKEFEPSKGLINFCSMQCRQGKQWTKEDKEKKSKSGKKFHKENGTLIKPRKCLYCNKSFLPSRNKRKFCSNECRDNRTLSDETKAKLSDIALERCKSINERIRLREIGRKGGFGKKGYTNNGTFYQSSLEQKCFEFLEQNNIIFEAHKLIPNSSKISDVFLINKNLWVEIDGINREKKKKWIGKDYDYWLDKIKEYKKNKLELKIVYSLEEFKKIAG